MYINIMFWVSWDQLISVHVSCDDNKAEIGRAGQTGRVG